MANTFLSIADSLLDSSRLQKKFFYRAVALIQGLKLRRPTSRTPGDTDRLKVHIQRYWSCLPDSLKESFTLEDAYSVIPDAFDDIDATCECEALVKSFLAGIEGKAYFKPDFAGVCICESGFLREYRLSEIPELKPHKLTKSTQSQILLNLECFCQPWEQTTAERACLTRNGYVLYAKYDEAHYAPFDEWNRQGGEPFAARINADFDPSKAIDGWKFDLAKLSEYAPTFWHWMQTTLNLDSTRALALLAIGATLCPTACPKVPSVFVLQGRRGCGKSQFLDLISRIHGHNCTKLELPRERDRFWGSGQLLHNRYHPRVLLTDDTDEKATASADKMKAILGGLYLPLEGKGTAASGISGPVQYIIATNARLRTSGNEEDEREKMIFIPCADVNFRDSESGGISSERLVQGMLAEADSIVSFAFGFFASFLHSQRYAKTLEPILPTLQDNLQIDDRVAYLDRWYSPAPAGRYSWMSDIKREMISDLGLPANAFDSSRELFSLVRKRCEAEGLKIEDKRYKHCGLVEYRIPLIKLPEERTPDYSPRDRKPFAFTPRACQWQAGEARTPAGICISEKPDTGREASEPAMNAATAKQDTGNTVHASESMPDITEHIAQMQKQIDSLTRQIKEIQFMNQCLDEENESYRAEVKKLKDQISLFTDHPAPRPLSDLEKARIEIKGLTDSEEEMVPAVADMFRSWEGNPQNTVPAPVFGTQKPSNVYACKSKAGEPALIPLPRFMRYWD